MTGQQAKQVARERNSRDAGLLLSSGMTEAERETFEERAAIREYDGGMTRLGAEGWTRREIIEARPRQAALL